jgi:hypothetical protein
MSRNAALTHLFRAMKASAAARALPKLAERARQEEWLRALRRGAALDRGLLARVLRRPAENPRRQCSLSETERSVTGSEPVVEPLKSDAGSNLVDVGRGAAHAAVLLAGGDSEAGLMVSPGKDPRARRRGQA